MKDPAQSIGLLLLQAIHIVVSTTFPLHNALGPLKVQKLFEGLALLARVRCAAHFRFRSKRGKFERNPFRLEPKKNCPRQVPVFNHFVVFCILSFCRLLKGIDAPSYRQFFKLFITFLASVYSGI